MLGGTLSTSPAQFITTVASMFVNKTKTTLRTHTVDKKVGRSVGRSVGTKMSRLKIICAHAQSHFWAVKTDRRHPCSRFLLRARAALA